MREGGGIINMNEFSKMPVSRLTDLIKRKGFNMKLGVSLYSFHGYADKSKARD